MPGGSKTRRGSAASDLAPGTPTGTPNRPGHELGSYVMVFWQQKFEYLAEVLAFRQRSRSQPEYRVKYIWDNVIEWTPASRIRPAKESEVVDVFNYLKQNQSKSSDLPSSSSAPKRDVEKKPPPSPSPAPHPKPQLSLDDDMTGEGTVAQGDMLYDKSVAQFTEACRKRREQKRKAALGDSPAHEDKQSQLPAPKPEPAPSAKKGSINRRPVSKRSLAASPLVPREAKRFRPNPQPPQVAPPAPQVAPTPEAQAAPPTFQCPYCPRTLRRECLLSAHLFNYHRGKVGRQGDSGLNDPSPDSPSAPTQAHQQPQQAGVGKKQKLSVNLDNGTSKSQQMDDKSAPAPARPEVLVYCPVCKFSGPSREPLQSLLQCSVCRVWTHKKCANHRNSPFTCVACYRDPSTHSREPLSNWPNFVRANEGGRGGVVAAAAATAAIPTPPGSSSAGQRATTTTSSSHSADITGLVTETGFLIKWIKHLEWVLEAGRYRYVRIKEEFLKSRRATDTQLLKPEAVGTPGVTTSANSAAVAAPTTAAALHKSEEPVGCSSASSSQQQSANLSAIDFPFISTQSSDEHFSALFMTLENYDDDSTKTQPHPEFTELLEKLGTHSPADLTDIIELSEDILPTGAGPSHSGNGGNSALAPNHLQQLQQQQLPDFDTPTKSMLARIDQEMAPVGTQLFPQATTTASDFVTNLSSDASLSVTPIKQPRTSAHDIEAASSLIGFAESSGRVEFGGPVVPAVCASGDHQPSSTEEAPSNDLLQLQSEILIPVQDMIDLIEGRLDVIESMVTAIVSAGQKSKNNRPPEMPPLPPRSSSSLMSRSDESASDEDDDYLDDDDDLDDFDDSLDDDDDDDEGQDGDEDENDFSLRRHRLQHHRVPQPKFAPKRRPNKYPRFD